MLNKFTRSGPNDPTVNILENEKLNTIPVLYRID